MSNNKIAPVIRMIYYLILLDTWKWIGSDPEAYDCYYECLDTHHYTKTGKSFAIWFVENKPND